jgi:tight adherence protein C
VQAVAEQLAQLKDFVLRPGSLLSFASILLGVSLAWFVASLLRIMYRRLPDEAASWEFENSRRIRLRSDSLLFRWFEPLVDELAALNLQWRNPEEFNKLQHCLNRIRRYPPWKPQEILAAHQMQGLGVGLGAFLFMLVIAGPVVAVFAAIAGFWFFTWLLRRQLVQLSDERVSSLKKRLPFAVDLMALMMEAGAGFHESLKTVVSENRGHVLAEEFGEALVRIEAGQGRSEALDQLESRLKDEDVSELVFAIIKGEELGTPMSQILSRQADQMRLKRIQWAEKAVSEAQVNITFPGFLIMIACLMVAASPFILEAIY